MARCSCSGSNCGCRFIAGAGISLAGSGQANDPVVISAESTGGGGGGWDPGDIKKTVRTDTPAGWLECNGQTISRTAYPALFAAIGTRWGAGDGFSTFTVPNFAGRTLVGAGPGYPMGASGGSVETTLTMENLPAHAHAIGNHQHGMNHSHSNAHDHGATSTESAVHTHTVAYKVDTNDNTETRGTGGAKRVTDVKIGTGDQTATTGPQPERHVHAVTPWAGRTDGATPDLTTPAGAQTTTSTGQGASFSNLPPYRAVRVLIKT